MRTPSAVLTVLALALAPAARAETKIAFVDFQRAGMECDEGRALAAALKKERDAKQADLAAKEKEFMAARDDFEKQQGVLSDAVKQQKAAELEKRGLDLQQQVLKATQEVGQREDQASKGVSERLGAVVRELAERDGIQMVLAKQALVYAPDALDITNEVIRKYNAKFPYKGGAVAPAGTKPADAGGKTPPKKPAK